MLSYLILGGKCRACKERISVRYALVELLNCGLWLIATWLYFEASPLYAVSVMIFCSLLICIAFIDWETMYIYDLIVYLIAIPVVMACIADYTIIVNRLLGVVAGGGIFLLLWLLFKFVMKKEGMGMGDVILMALIGAYLGWEATLVAILIASLLGCLILLPIQLIRKNEREKQYPFAPFLTLGAVIALFVTNPALEWYLALFGL